MPNDYDAWLNDFDEGLLAVGDIETAVYAAPPVKDSPTVLFIHGINGDFHGLVPVAYNLRHDYRAVFVDLPGHGRTAIPSGDLFTEVSAWATALPGALERAGIHIDAAVGHSFGCFVAAKTGARRAALLNPPFAASALSRHGTKLLERAASVVGGVYSSYPAMIRRGHWLLHTRTQEADDIIAWSSRHTHVSKKQFCFQARFAEALTSTQVINVQQLQRIPRLLIVTAEFDRVVDNTQAPLDELPQARIVVLPTDHVSIFEMPERVADEIRDMF